MSKLWLLLLLAVFVCLLLESEAQNGNRRRNRNRNRDMAGPMTGRGPNGGGRRRPNMAGGHRGRGRQRGRGQGRRRQPGGGRRMNRGVGPLLEATRPFQLNVYKQLSGTAPNVIVSSYSILTALSMVSLGAQLQTGTELRSTMGVDRLHPRKTHKAFKNLASALQATTSGNVTMTVANAIFAKEGLRIKNGFRRRLRKFYNAEMKNFDMSNPEGPEKPINDWVAANTGNMIRDFLSPRTITPQTVMWLLNAIYFKGLWKIPFETRNTRSQPFYISNADQTTVDMMFLNSRFPMASNTELQARVLEVPYAGDAVSMIIFLPEEIEGLSFLENNLTPERLESAITQLGAPAQVDLSLPRMKVEFEADLKDALQQLGIRRMFEQGQAELGGMVADRRMRLFVSDAKHKAVLEVNEEGTAASAATGIGISLMSAPIGVPEFNVNHPFMFVLRDKVNNVNLFLGKYTDPRRAM